MITIFKKTMSAAKMVAEYKASNNLPILDLKRENELIKRNTQILNDQELVVYFITFFVVYIFLTPASNHVNPINPLSLDDSYIGPIIDSSFFTS